MKLLIFFKNIKIILKLKKFQKTFLKLKESSDL